MDESVCKNLLKSDWIKTFDHLIQEFMESSVTRIRISSCCFVTPDLIVITFQVKTVRPRRWVASFNRASLEDAWSLGGDSVFCAVLAECLSAGNQLTEHKGDKRETHLTCDFRFSDQLIIIIEHHFSLFLKNLLHPAVRLIIESSSLDSHMHHSILKSMKRVIFCLPTDWRETEREKWERNPSWFRFWTVNWIFIFKISLSLEPWIRTVLKRTVSWKASLAQLHFRREKREQKQSIKKLEKRR